SPFRSGMFPFAELRVSSALTGMLNGANPLLTAIVAACVTRRAPSGDVMCGLIVGLAGTTLLAWPALGEGTGSAEGIGLIVAALVSYALALGTGVALRRARRRRWSAGADARVSDDISDPSRSARARGCDSGRAGRVDLRGRQRNLRRGCVADATG